MNKSNINELSAGTEADNNPTAQNKHVSQPNANTNVGGSRPLDKLMCLNDFVDNIRDYVNESQSHERGLKLIFDYNDFLNQDIKEEMFTGENCLFPGFKNIMQSEALLLQIKKSFQKDSEGNFTVCVYRKVGKEYNIPERTTYVTSFHLKTVNDLIGKIDEHNSFNESFGWRELS